MNINIYDINLDEIIFTETLLDAFFFGCQCALFLVDMTNINGIYPIKSLISVINNEKYSYLTKIMVEIKSDKMSGIKKDELNYLINNQTNMDHIIINSKKEENMDKLLDIIYDSVNSDLPEKNEIPINHIAKYDLKSCPIEEINESISLILVGDTGVGKSDFMDRFAII